MRAKIVRIHSPDIADLPGHAPADPSCFGFYLEFRVEIGEFGAAQAFGLVACTPRWLAKELRANDGILSGHSYVFVERYDWPRLAAWLKEQVENTHAECRASLVGKLNRLFYWEGERATDACAPGGVDYDDPALDIAPPPTGRGDNPIN